HPNVRARRIAIRHNLLLVDRQAHGGTGRCLTVGRAPQEIEFSFNTCIANGSAAIYTYLGGSERLIRGAVFLGKVFLHSSYGSSAEVGGSGGMAAFDLYYPDGVFADNLIGGGSASGYPGNYLLGLTEFKAQFLDYGGGEFQLTDAAKARFPV